MKVTRFWNFLNIQNNQHIVITWKSESDIKISGSLLQPNINLRMPDIESEKTWTRSWFQYIIQTNEDIIMILTAPIIVAAWNAFYTISAAFATLWLALGLARALEEPLANSVAVQTSGLSHTNFNILRDIICCQKFLGQWDLSVYCEISTILYYNHIV